MITSTQLLLLVITAIPLLNCLMFRFCAEFPKLTNFVNKIMPVLFAANLFGLYGSLKSDNSYLTLIEAMRGISIGFFVDRIAFGFLVALNFFWLVFVFYSRRFLQISLAKNIDDLMFFFTLAIAFITLIILGKNLLSVLFFYNCLIFLSYFFAAKFLHRGETRFSRFFVFLLYLEAIFFFLAIVATYKFTAQIEFGNGGNFGTNFDRQKHALLLILYLIGLFFSVLFPAYLFYRNINLDTLVLYVFFFLSYAFVSLYIFIKIIAYIFGFHGFAILIKAIGFSVFEGLFLFNIIAASLFLLFSKGIKSSFFYLFFHQFVICLFLIFLVAVFDAGKVYIPIFSFLFSFTLIFLCLSNLVLYLTKAADKSMSGLFYSLTITSSLLIFAFANMLGIAPAFGAIEKFFVIKIIWQKKLLISAMILLVNFISIAILAWKMIMPLFLRVEKSIEDNDLAKNIDYDSSLILTGLTVAILIFLGLVLFSPIINFFEI
ncbi:MAG: hypothetical protein A2887_00965 [Alphaproteobacteria bacterium RIFCSPLOWO2_01_FULL_40_26]|nr:MAG: hypothetical protein A3D15_04670 [Alphaproteobacteria bacterium RIFCSPHIGHO2_02_FULL_40_34]OFW88633.1 MAG: hypothetical protein A2794_04990 [Alphaproteobacteria bacterium RIFCSPHIGHO2_01_FULL_40_8]OFW95468.1 MAG: hypothetical protein A2887_00965 [Alphaproteobacteria bacterium RIFCSPLOWO2_01_FULL_40_26]OFX10275.1 MAG: hypothetical protein A3H30_00945 [Alphaproteobacteria bacterium RIFCSPLOWO2_02_FULL_40_19]